MAGLTSKTTGSSRRQSSIADSPCGSLNSVASRAGCEASWNEARDSTDEVRRAPSEDTTKQPARAAAIQRSDRQAAHRSQLPLMVTSMSRRRYLAGIGIDGSHVWSRQMILPQELHSKRVSWRDILVCHRKKRCPQGSDDHSAGLR